MKFWIKENSHWYLPIFLLPHFKRNLKMKVTFSQMSWYDDTVQPGVNKLLMLGKLFHYADYCTVGWQWTDARPDDLPKNIFKGRCLRLYSFYHDDWHFPQWYEIATIRTDKDYDLLIERHTWCTVWYIDQIWKHTVAVKIKGRTLRSPYFGGRGKSFYNHMIKIKWS